TPLPSRIGVVDPRVEPFGEKADRIRNAQHHHLPVLEGDEAVIEIGGRDRNVFAKAYRVVLVDPGPVARLGACVLKTLETRPRIFVEGKAFRTMIPRRLRSVERALALAAVEADQSAVRTRSPQHAVL